MPLIAFVLLIVVLAKFVIPRLADAAANILWAILIIVIAFVVSSNLGIRLPYIGGIQEAVTQWFDATLLPSLKTLIANIQGQIQH